MTKTFMGVEEGQEVELTLKGKIAFTRSDYVTVGDPYGRQSTIVVSHVADCKRHRPKIEVGDVFVPKRRHDNLERKILLLQRSESGAEWVVYERADSQILSSLLTPFLQTYIRLN